MNGLDTYREFVNSLCFFQERKSEYPLGDRCEFTLPPADGDLTVMLFSPHPDDEVAVAGPVALRLRQELHARVINIAVTLGSRLDRRAGRLAELTECCAMLDFELRLPCSDGFDGINLKSRELPGWAEKVNIVAEIILDEQPQILVFPHDNDFNSTHIGTHYLVRDALAECSRRDPDFEVTVIESEFWHPMEGPNLMIGLSRDDEARIVTALAAHEGEVERNPYHLLHPVRMMDNVMRGSEVIGGQGEAAASIEMAMIYRLRQWKMNFVDVLPSGKIIAPNQPLDALIGLDCT